MSDPSLAALRWFALASTCLLMVAMVSNFWILFRSRKSLAKAMSTLRQAEVIYRQAEEFAAKIGRLEAAAEAYDFQWQHSDAETLCLLGYPIRIRRTAIGKQFRLEQDGQDEIGFDSFQEAMCAGMVRAVEMLKIDNAPEKPI